MWKQEVVPSYTEMSQNLHEETKENDTSVTVVILQNRDKSSI